MLSNKTFRGSMRAPGRMTTFLQRDPLDTVNSLKTVNSFKLLQLITAVDFVQGWVQRTPMVQGVKFGEELKGLRAWAKASCSLGCCGFSE